MSDWHGGPRTWALEQTKRHSVQRAASPSLSSQRSLPSLPVGTACAPNQRVHSQAPVQPKPLAMVLLGLVLVVGLWASPAEAQSIKVEPSQYRFKRDVERPNYPFWISREDCLRDKKHGDGETFIEVQPNLSPVGNYALQVWVARGADCTDNEIRLTQGSCWNVLDEIALVNNKIYEISTQEIVAGGEPITDDTCDAQVEWSTTLYFLLLDGDTVLASTKWSETQVDTKAPPPPVNITASGGDNAIFLAWDAPLDQQVIDAQGFAYYCAGGGMEVMGQAGASGLGGGSGVSCTAGNLTPGDYPDESTRCGSTGSPSSRSGVVASPGVVADSVVPIANGNTYGVGIAALDRVGNVGLLSPLTCATPQPVISFFEHYKDSGGRAGGSFCGLVPGSAPSRHAGLWGVGFGLGLLAAYRLRLARRAAQNSGARG